MTEPMLEPEIVGLPKRLPMTKALRDLLALVTGKPWEIGRIPTIPDPAKPSKRISVDPTFGILYPLGRTRTGPPRKPIVRWIYQATVVVERADQLEVFDDKVQAAIVGRTADNQWAYPLIVPGMHVVDRETGDENTGGGGTPAADVTTELPTRDIMLAITVNAHQETP